MGSRFVSALVAAAGLSLLAAVLPAWQLLVVKPSVDRVYGSAPSIGWGFPVCMLGLALMTAMSILLVIRARLPAGDQ